MTNELARIPRAHAIQRAVDRLVASFWYRLGPRIAARRTIHYGDCRRPLLAHRYNRTWLNERAIEVPIARCFLEQVSGRGLEVGNVLSHYQPVDHLVIDKYEVAPGVVNRDVLELDGTYDYIISISTVEHVGFDEKPRDPSRGPAAIERMKTVLRSGGRMLVTAPFGHNPTLDGAIASGALGPDRETFFSRGRSVTRWRRVPKPPAPDYRPPASLRGSRSLWVAEWVR